MPIKKNRAIAILGLILTIFSLMPISALAHDSKLESQISPQEQRRIQDIYGLGPPPEAPSTAIGDFGFQIGGLSGSFSGSDLSNPHKSALLFVRLGIWTFASLPSAARFYVLAVTNPSN